MWNPQTRHKYTRRVWPSVAAKIISVVLPGILIGIVQFDFVLERRILQIILGNLCSTLCSSLSDDGYEESTLTDLSVELSFSFGSIVIIATLIKYLINRKAVSYGSSSSNVRKGSVSVKPAHAMEDRWIIFRFTAAFVILRYWAFSDLQITSRSAIHEG